MRTFGSNEAPPFVDRAKCGADERREIGEGEGGGARYLSFGDLSESSKSGGAVVAQLHRFLLPLQYRDGNEGRVARQRRALLKASSNLGKSRAQVDDRRVDLCLAFLQQNRREEGVVHFLP